jgi:hypothetical protein
MNAAVRAGKLDDDTDTQNEFEGEIREFIRRDVSHLRRPTNEASEQAVSNINSLIDRVSGSSVSEIDRLMVDLQRVRDFLASEGERVQREIAGYAQLSQVAMTSVKIIAESMHQWKTQVGDRDHLDHP